MSQITSGIRSLLSSSRIYCIFQNLMGAHKGRSMLVEDFIRPFSRCMILDIGCGPADILDYLTDVEYYGFDISEEYIKAARSKFGNRANFYCKKLTQFDIDQLPKFDVVLAVGLLHHLDDDEANKILQLAYYGLKLGGRLLTVDPCIDDAQGLIARFLVKCDRGQNVRNKNGYTDVVNKVFNKFHVEIRHKLWIPYTHCFIECVRIDPVQ